MSLLPVAKLPGRSRAAKAFRIGIAIVPASLIAISAPTRAWADVPTVDDTNRDERQQRDRAVSGIAETDNDRHTVHASVTCAMYHPAKNNDPVASADANPEISGLVRRIAQEEGVDENQFLGLVYQESRFNPCAKSPAGATGLAQLMPGTAAQLGVNPNNIEDNLRGGARYYKQQLDSFGGSVPLALAAYNSGPGNVSKYGGIPPFKETQNYVASITQQWMPAFGGSDKSGIPLNFGGGEVAFTGTQSTTVNAMATTSAVSDSLPDAAAWYQQVAQIDTGTIQDSWDHNSTVRNANLSMMSNVIKLEIAMASLLNSRTSETASHISGSSQSTGSTAVNQNPKKLIGLCDPHQNQVWSDEEHACIEQRELAGQPQLLLQAQ
ncbi:lytic transglycosylase domain-containing protein [Rhizobium sp. A22-96]